LVVVAGAVALVVKVTWQFIIWNWSSIPMDKIKIHFIIEFMYNDSNK
jgi:hypothetical protein